MIALFCIKTLTISLLSSLAKDFSANHHELCINVIMFACFQSTGVLPVLCLDRPGLCLGQQGLFWRHQVSTGKAPALTIASPGLCLDDPECILCG
jgi:hypothetical protein